MKKEKHKHAFNKLVENKVLLRKQGKLLVGWDIIKARKCVCGEQEAFDIKERVRV